MLVCVSAAKDSPGMIDKIENYSEIMKYVGNLERGMHEMNKHIQRLEKMSNEQAVRIKTQESKIEKQINEIEMLKQEVAELKLKTKVSDNFPLQSRRYSELHHKADPSKMEHTPKDRRYLLADAKDSQFGFSAYLDHGVSNLGIDQTIIFNQILFNDGGAYNNASGIYTCPTDGVYLFFFAVGSGSQHQIVAKLVTNGVNQVDAIADSEFHLNQEAHASNMVILRLVAGTHV